MKYHFFKSLLIRTPLYGFDQYQKQIERALLKDELFQSALFLSSKEFYDELSKKDFECDFLNERERHTLQKYYNRASFRSTPFGLFSSFSLSTWTGKLEPMILSTHLKPIFKLDFSVLATLGRQVSKGAILKNGKFRPNQSLLLNGRYLRYIQSEVIKSGQIDFSLISINTNSILQKLLEFCKPGKHLTELYLFLQDETGEDPDTIYSYLQELCDNQVIQSELLPNVTGKDYQNVLLSSLIQQESQSNIVGLIQDLEETNEVRLDGLVNLSAALTPMLDSKSLPKSIFYSLAQRSALQGGLPMKYQQQIMDGLYCLDIINTTANNPLLTEFIHKFKDRYDLTEIPLLEALDPQLGIGYGNFAEMKKDGIFSTPSSNDKDSEDQKLADSENRLREILLNDWHQQSNIVFCPEIEIREDQLRELALKAEKAVLPPSISVMFRIAGDKVVIEQAGGVSALSLLGRFSCDEKVYQFAREISQKEQHINPTILFAEIAHLSDMHSANINRRRHLRDYEIPVLTTSDMADENQLALSDLLLSYHGGGFILRSRKSGKMVIPRLGSAYNFTKSAYSVFRFLCDLQSQHLKANLSFSLPDWFPGMRFYPRVRYKNTIVQLAEWHFEAQIFKGIQEANSNKRHELFTCFRNENNLPRFVALIHFDNYLIYDLESGKDTSFLLREVKGKSSVVLREFPFMESNAHASDEKGNRLLTQYVASLYNDEATYPESFPNPDTIEKNETVQNGKSWIYFKIYCHPLSADSILTEHLLPFIEKNRRKGILQQFFWIRYLDPNYHIRFRVRPAKGKYGQLFERLQACLLKLHLAKAVSHFQTDLYKWETKRYTAVLMNQVEAIFESSSRIAFAFLQQKNDFLWDDEQTLLQAVLSARVILDSFQFTPVQKANFCKDQFDLFYAEFGSPKGLKAEIEELVKRFSSELNSGSPASLQPVYAIGLIIKKTIQIYARKKISAVSIQSLAADIIHMHLNRLFTVDQRYGEMIVYYVLHRNLSIQEFRAQHQQLTRL